MIIKIALRVREWHFDSRKIGEHSSYSPSFLCLILYNLQIAHNRHRLLAKYHDWSVYFKIDL